MGYLLENYASVSGVTKELYQVCLEQTGKSKRYLSKDVFEGTYNAKWKMVVPDKNVYLKNGGQAEDDRI